MRTVTEHLNQYAAYHQNHRNVLTHVFGIPLIVLAVAALLTRIGFTAGPLHLTAAFIVLSLAALYYIWLDLALGVAMAFIVLAILWLAHIIADLSLIVWLSLSIGLLVLGWVLQFIGHGFEGRKPAFFDDITSLLIGPLFVLAELAFRLGLRRGLQPQPALSKSPPV